MKLLVGRAKDFGFVKHIATFGAVTDEDIINECETLGIQLMNYSDVLVSLCYVDLLSSFRL